jgi:hypothetical protein
MQVGDLVTGDGRWVGAEEARGQRGFRYGDLVGCHAVVVLAW